jgi:uncharacterized Tic20 family protein
MNKATFRIIGRTSKPKWEFKKWYFYLLVSLVALAPFGMCLMGYTNREMVLVGMCLTALAGICFIATFAMISTFASLFKRMKERQRRVLRHSGFNNIPPTSVIQPCSNVNVTSSLNPV